MAEGPIHINPPNTTSAEELSAGVFPYDKFMGTWNVVWSTLPLWKDKQDVTITYSPLPTGEGAARQFDDLVRYRKQGQSDFSTVKGVDTCDMSDLTTGATFNWRGKGWLMIASSHWQVLGYDPAPGLAWAVTYFSKTLFTPAGLDIYLREEITPQNERIVDEIVARLESLGGEVGQLAKSGFIVGR